MGEGTLFVFKMNVCILRGEGGFWWYFDERMNPLGKPVLKDLHGEVPGIKS